MTAVPGLSEQDFDVIDGTEDLRTGKPAKQQQQMSNLQKSRPPIGPRSYSYGSGAEMCTTSFNGRKISSQEVSFAESTGESPFTPWLNPVFQTEQYTLHS